jgi:hypothetical protein
MDVEAGSATVGQLSKVYLERQELRTDLKASSKEHRKFVVLSIMRTWPEPVDGRGMSRWKNGWKKNFSDMITKSPAIVKDMADLLKYEGDKLFPGTANAAKENSVVQDVATTSSRFRLCAGCEESPAAVEFVAR